MRILDEITKREGRQRREDLNRNFCTFWWQRKEEIGEKDRMELSEWKENSIVQ